MELRTTTAYVLRERYIYILSYGVVYIYLCIFVYVCSLDVVCPCMVLSVVFKLHAFVILDVHGFGYWKNKLRLSGLM